MICDILNRADENGIMEVYPTIDKELVTDDETLDELVEKASRSDSSSSSVPQSSQPSTVASSLRYYITFSIFVLVLFGKL